MKKLLLTFRNKFIKPIKIGSYELENQKSNKKGFTIAELLMATMILAILITTAAGVFTNFFSAIRNIRAANLVYEEARFTMERIVKEIRNGTLDYEEYYNQAANFFDTGINRTYGQNYCQYSRQFYSPGPDGQFGTFDDESTGLRNEDSAIPIESPIQEKLYLININGTQRTYIQRAQTTDSFGEPIGKVAILKLVGRDYGMDHLGDENSLNCPRDTGEKDGLIDTWMCEEGFACEVVNLVAGENLPDGCTRGRIDIVKDDPENLSNSSFVDITPESLDIVDLKFFITPEDDPRKAYNKPEIHIQPHITVKLIARANPRIASQFKGKTPTIVLESTISTRAHREIITECNLQECIDGDEKRCPKGFEGTVAEGAMQTCINGVWPGCTDEVYEEWAFLNLEGLDMDPAFASDPGGGRSYYESNNSEINSCTDDACKQRRCNDGQDNDCDGLADENDPDCLIHLCTNGHLDPGEECIDVGGICYFRPLEPLGGETSCDDNYDNDCSYDFHLKDSATWWDDLTQEQRDQIEDEGLDENSSLAELNIALRLGADEYDQSCIDLFCGNSVHNTGTFGKLFMDSPNYLFEKEISTELDEVCINIGGICARDSSGEQALMNAEVNNVIDNQDDYEIGDLCFDGLDNDCDYDETAGTGGADEFDPECKPVICENEIFNYQLIDPSIVDADENYDYDFLVSYEDALGSVETALDEVCTDGGGICWTGEWAVGGPETEYKDLEGIIHLSLSDPPNNYCFDNKDNDCDGLEDSEDDDCCPNLDGDGFHPRIDNSCTPKDAFGSPPYGNIDCNDSDPSIHPDALEVCDGAIYPSDYPVIDFGDGRIKNLADSPIDNNCSFINGLTTSAEDEDDPACCYDLDGDGFGIEDAYIACATAAIGFDCLDVSDDIDPAEVNPSIIEETEAQCTDGFNNNCKISLNTSAERIDHIDMYANDAGGIELAYTLELFEPECCGLTATSYNPNLEVCNDTDSLLSPGADDSDNNCNGLSGYDDHHCITADKLSFYDYFSQSLFVNLGASTAQYLQNAYPDPTYKDSRFTLADPSVENVGTVISNNLPLDTGTTCSNDVLSVTINHNADIPAGTAIDYEVSNDGGATYEAYAEGVGNAHNFLVLDGDNHDLRWQATLTGNGVDTAPVLNDIILSFTCD